MLVSKIYLAGIEIFDAARPCVLDPRFDCLLLEKHHVDSLMDCFCIAAGLQKASQFFDLGLIRE